MVIGPKEYSKQATNDMFIAHSLGVTQTTQNMEFKLSPWDQDELIKYRKSKMAKNGKVPALSGSSSTGWCPTGRKE